MKQQFMCSKCGSDIHKISTCPLLPCKHCYENGHTSNTCPQLNEGRRASRRVAALEPLRIGQLREAHRIRQLNEEQIRRHNERSR